MTSSVVLILKVFVLLSSSSWLSFNARAEISELPCAFLHSINISDGERDISGIIEHRGVLYDPINYASVNYSYDDAGDEIAVSVHTRGCVCQVKNCVWLCCNRKEISYHGEYPTCSNFNATDGLIVEMTSDTDTAEKVDLTARDNIFMAVFEASCNLFEAEPEEWNMNASGYVRSLETHQIVQEEYCLHISGDAESPTLYFCSKETIQDSLSAPVATGLILSIPFLVATLLIYAWIPELRNIHGKSLICYVFALTSAYIDMLLTHFHSSIVPCVARAYLFYFFVMVSFFWLNVMCFDIFWTFSSGVLIKNENKRFLYYSLYAWGWPLILVAMVAVFENTELIHEDLRPGFGINNCSFISLILSIPFLVATLLIYAWIPELRNIHGKSLICYVFALTSAYIVMLMSNFHTTIVPCVARAYLFYFFVMVSFFWLNVMCFDIFWTFSSGVLIKNESKRFLYYSLYAWGCPLMLVAMVAVFENTELIHEHLRPGFGINNCSFVNEKLIQFLYLYLPLLILVAMNLYFFIVTAIRIIRVQRATDAALRNDSGRHSRFEKDRYRFALYLRLFIVMGVTWTFEILSWAMENNTWIFYVTDICNCMLGVMIFFLFVWKQKVRKLVAKRIGRHRNLSRTKTTSVNATSTAGGSKYTSVQDTTTVVPLSPVTP